MTTTLGVIGGGVLGRAVARGFMEHAEVRVYDVIHERSTHYHLGDVATCDIVMICLPTPANPDGTCNTLAIDDFLRTAQLEEYWRPHSCYVIRSTVPVGYTQQQAATREFKLPLLHSPEFLTARCALTDFQIPARNIIGVPMTRTGAIDSAICRLRWLYVTRFSGVPVHFMPSEASELVKLACNSFFAAKVTLFNLFAEVAESHNLSWRDVLAGILSDGRIAHAHTQVPGPDGRNGFGGSCIPKDLADLFHCCREAGVDAGLLKEILERNERTRGPHDEQLTRVTLPSSTAGLT